MFKKALMALVISLFFVFSIQAVSAYTLQDLINYLQNLFSPSAQEEVTGGLVASQASACIQGQECIFNFQFSEDQISTVFIEITDLGMDLTYSCPPSGSLRDLLHGSGCPVEIRAGERQARFSFIIGDNVPVGSHQLKVYTKYYFGGEREVRFEIFSVTSQATTTTTQPTCSTTTTTPPLQCGPCQTNELTYCCCGGSGLGNYWYQNQCPSPYIVDTLSYCYAWVYKSCAERCQGMWAIERNNACCCSSGTTTTTQPSTTYSFVVQVAGLTGASTRLFLDNNDVGCLSNDNAGSCLDQKILTGLSGSHTVSVQSPATAGGRTCTVSGSNSVTFSYQGTYIFGYSCSGSTTTTTTVTDDPCDTAGTWRKYSVYCCEGDCTTDSLKVRGFCLGKDVYSQNTDKLELVLAGTTENCVKCKNDVCCHNIRGLCFDFSPSSSTGCSFPGPVTSACSSANGNRCDSLSNVQGCTLRESSNITGPIYCANCAGTTTTTSSTTTTQPGPTTTQPTTTTTTQPSTTTTTTPQLLTLECKGCYVGSKCACELTTTCEEGKWMIENKEGKPLPSYILENIPPIKIEYTPNATGKVKVTTTCYLPAPRRDNITVVEVKEEFLKCPSECRALTECSCKVVDCENGKFQAFLGNTILKNENITTTSYTAKFIPEKTGVAEVYVYCYKPSRDAAAKIAITTGTTTTTITGAFTGSDFRCISTTISGAAGYKCYLDYSNNYGTAYLVFFLSKPSGEIVQYNDPPITVLSGTGTKDISFTCSNRAGRYLVSWTAFTSSDMINPIPGAWPKPGERKEITC
jgi:hypothetical protein